VSTSSEDATWSICASSAVTTDRPRGDRWCGVGLGTTPSLPLERPPLSASTAADMSGSRLPASAGVAAAAEVPGLAAAPVPAPAAVPVPPSASFMPLMPAIISRKDLHSTCAALMSMR